MTDRFLRPENPPCSTARRPPSLTHDYVVLHLVTEGTSRPYRVHQNRYLSGPVATTLPAAARPPARSGWRLDWAAPRSGVLAPRYTRLESDAVEGCAVEQGLDVEDAEVSCDLLGGGRRGVDSFQGRAQQAQVTRAAQEQLGL